MLFRQELILIFAAIKKQIIIKIYESLRNCFHLESRFI